MIRPVKRPEVVQVEQGVPSSGVTVTPPAWRLIGLDFLDRMLLDKVHAAQERITKNRLEKAQGECAVSGTCSLRFIINHNGRLDGKREFIFTCPRKAKGCADRARRVTEKNDRGIYYAMKRMGFWADQQK